MVYPYSLLISFFFYLLLSKSFYTVKFYLAMKEYVECSVLLSLDEWSLSFAITIGVIFLGVSFYSCFYMSEEIFLKRFFWLLNLFVLSMLALVFSGNLFTSLVGWDSLGVTSMFLILFYYSDSSKKASTLTFLMNRVGDCFFILLLINTLLLGGWWDFLISSKLESFMGIMIIMCSLTKSAQIPFSSWLPAAMEAPTPVSALVHSSTLVTAGIFILFRYSHFWLSHILKEFLMVVSVSTCFMAATAAVLENDLKKLIALSTLSQMGFIMTSISLGEMTSGFIHMLTHASFKALLFMVAGYIIHSFKGSQNILHLSGYKDQSPLILMIMTISILSMAGLPFTAGFYSKDLVIDSFVMGKSFETLLYHALISSFVLTVLYSTRMVWYLMNSSCNWNSMNDCSWDMIKPMFPLTLLSLFSGSLWSWLFHAQLQVFVDSSKVLILLLISGVMLAYWLSEKNQKSSFLISKWYLDDFNTFLSKEVFKIMSNYQESSDLQGFPEVALKNSMWHIFLISEKVLKTMKPYFNKVEMVTFLALTSVILI